jgi:ABC-2 type transport system permease protein
MSALSTMAAVCVWTWRKSMRRPTQLTFSFVQPWIWLALFGLSFHRYAIPGRSYLDYMTPGVACMTVLFGASQSGVPWLRDMQTGFLARVWRSPAPRSVVLGAKVAADTARLLLQALLLCGLGVLAGANLEIQPTALPLAVTAVAALGAGFSLLSCAMALTARNPETMGTYVHLVNLPVLFTSSALVPRGDLPEWLSVVAALNPMSVAADALRAAALPSPTPVSPDQLAVSLGWVAVAALCAGLALARHTSGR